MGIYIKGYKIPNGECEHLVLDFENMTAFAAFGDRKHYELIEVTEPQGDVIGYTWKLEPVESEDG